MDGPFLSDFFFDPVTPLSPSRLPIIHNVQKTPSENNDYSATRRGTPTEPTVPSQTLSEMTQDIESSKASLP